MGTKTKSQKPPEEPKAVADEKDNAKLKHSEGGVTTRDDALDQGVPVLQGDGSEPVGPEDAHGPGKKRGDYRERQDGAQHFTSEPVEGGGEPVRDKDGNITDLKPVSRLVDQNARVHEIGEVKGEKGGVTTTE